jgi:transcriptional regulator with XRE-family HTH domain
LAKDHDDHDQAQHMWAEEVLSSVDETPPTGRTTAVEQAGLSSVGAALRAIRERLGMTRSEVAQRSAGEFGISSLGAYERGDRVLNVDRLLRLAQLYRVDVSELMPHRPEVTIDLPAVEQQPLPLTGLILDPSRLRVLSDDAAEAANRFRAAILALRRRHAQQIVVVRKSDSPLLAAVLGCDATLVDRLLAPAIPMARTEAGSSV